MPAAFQAAACHAASASAAASVGVSIGAFAALPAGALGPNFGAGRRIQGDRARARASRSGTSVRASSSSSTSLPAITVSESWPVWLRPKCPARKTASHAPCARPSARGASTRVANTSEPAARRAAALLTVPPAALPIASPTVPAAALLMLVAALMALAAFALCETAAVAALAVPKSSATADLAASSGASKANNVMNAETASSGAVRPPLAGGGATGATTEVAFATRGNARSHSYARSQSVGAGICTSSAAASRISCWSCCARCCMRST